MVPGTPRRLNIKHDGADSAADGRTRIPGKKLQNLKTSIARWKAAHPTKRRTRYTAVIGFQRVS